MMRTVALLLAVIAGSGSPALAQQPLTVVELFTSQGCSSCPPADRLLDDLARRDDLLALSYHVDYWNYIGWQDPFSRPSFSDRQRGYARQLGLRHVYTPQIVVQGRRSVVGSDRATVLEAIRDMDDARRVLIIAEVLDDGTARVALGTPPPEPAELLLVVYDRQHRTQVARGENRGRTLVNTHVVREVVRLGAWPDGGERYDVPARPVGEERAVILQALGNGHILGACRLDARSD